MLLLTIFMTARPERKKENRQRKLGIGEEDRVHTCTSRILEAAVLKKENRQPKGGMGRRHAATTQASGGLLPSFGAWYFILHNGKAATCPPRRTPTLQRGRARRSRGPVPCGIDPTPTQCSDTQPEAELSCLPHPTELGCQETWSVESAASHPGPGSYEAHPAGRMIGIGRAGGARSCALAVYLRFLGGAAALAAFAPLQWRCWLRL